MKKLITMLALSLALFSCTPDENNDVYTNVVENQNANHFELNEFDYKSTKYNDPYVYVTKVYNSEGHIQVTRVKMYHYGETLENPEVIFSVPVTKQERTIFYKNGIEYSRNYKFIHAAGSTVIKIITQ